MWRGVCIVGRFQLVSPDRRSGRRPTCPGVTCGFVGDESDVEDVEPDFNVRCQHQ